ncbi:SdpI family protein [Silvanigrella aquatica]|uniref:Uncharacterized protein n=1 Tax=Silvanigrella aquatica TaxID=1915309 RepID=A0A1L4CX73_9BACT|nr:hypothetical protein AXG55_00750 [Silvanigrella aquatica]
MDFKFYQSNIEYGIINFIFLIVAFLIVKVKINKWVGYRTCKSMSSLSNWRILNKKLAKYIAITQIISLFLNFILFLLKYININLGKEIFLLLDILLLIYFVFSIFFSFALTTLQEDKL